MTKHVTVHLTDDQRTHLETLTRAGSSPARLQTKARILLLTDRSQGHHRTDKEIAAALTVSRPTIIRTRQRFILDGLDAALHDRPRPGAVPKITGVAEAKLTLLACSTPPDGHARWTLRLLAEQMVALEYVDAICHVTVGERLKKTTSSRGE
jgi:transposase